MNVIVAPQDSESLLPVKFPHPKDPKKLVSYFYDEQNLRLYEAIKFEDPFRSWFLDNSFERSGHMLYMTRLDPLFIFLPQLIEHASQQFKSVDDICTSFNLAHNDNHIKLDYALAPDIVWGHICEIKQVAETTYVRYSQESTLEWLAAKYQRTIRVVRDQININMTGSAKDGTTSRVSNATCSSYAHNLIAQYIPVGLVQPFKDKCEAVLIDSEAGVKIDCIDKDACNIKEPVMNRAGSSQRAHKLEHFTKGSKRHTAEPSQQASKNPRGTLFQYFDKKRG